MSAPAKIAHLVATPGTVLLLPLPAGAVLPPGTMFFLKVVMGDNVPKGDWSEEQNGFFGLLHELLNAGGNGLVFEQTSSVLYTTCTMVTQENIKAHVRACMAQASAQKDPAVGPCNIELVTSSQLQA